MMRRSAARTSAIAAFCAATLLALAACHSYHIDTTIENRTGAPVQLLEVDYPDASFGADALAAGAVFHYRFVVRGSGPLKITYTGADRKLVHITGPTLSEPVQGWLQIVLLPAGQARFVPKFSAAR